MFEQNEYANEIRGDLEKSTQQISDILKSVDYDPTELTDISEPNVLILGSAPLFPEPNLLKSVSESNSKKINVDCIEKEDIGREYVDMLLGITNSEYFNMNLINTTFEEFEASKQYDLILLLRISNLAMIEDIVFEKISKNLKKDSLFIMSGGIPNSFLGTSLKKGNLNLEKKYEIVDFSNDTFRAYSGKNLVLKFRKY